MLSIGWTEMMLVAAVALIIVGPKDLPGMLRHIGKAVGSVRRMGNDFKAELNKIAAVDELKGIKKSIASPLTDMKQSIEKEFNSIAPSGEVIPSGKITPSDPDAQSVADEIKSAAGMNGSTDVDGSAAKASMAAAVTEARENSMSVTDAVKANIVKTPRKPRRSATKAVATNVKTTKKPAGKKTATKKPVTEKPAKSEAN